MTTPYTPEERERATEQLTAMMSMRGTSAEHINSAICRLNRLERREAEARELLDVFVWCAEQDKSASWFVAKENGRAWLSEEGV